MKLKSTAADLDGHLRRNAFGEALVVADALLALNPRNLEAWVGRARSNLAMAKIFDADNDLDMALKLSPSHHHANWLRGVLDHRLGRIDQAIERLRKLSLAKTPCSIDASFSLAETLYFSHRRDEYKQFIQAGGDWTKDPRAEFFMARARAREDPLGTIDDLLRIMRQDTVGVLKSLAGFDAVILLDKAGRYREAFDVAVYLHANAKGASSFDLEGLLSGVREQHSLLQNRVPWFKPRADVVASVSIVVGLPRCGSTLFEQMLDGHSKVSGIGEYDGVRRLGNGFVSSGISMQGIGMMPRELAQNLQSDYLDGATRFKREGAEWTFDKTLRAWRLLPVIAAALPGAVCFHVARDPRDMAISTFLAYINPTSDGWTADIDSIRRVIEAERSLLPDALDTLEIPNEQIVYENLVADPDGHARRSLARLGLDMEPDIVQPERNTRAVFTLSHEQVKRSINTASIGRWKNYEFAFDDSWRALAATHDARRV